MKITNETSRRAFTIVELLVVVAIIALLIAILLPAIGKAKDGALVLQSSSNLGNLVRAQATYGADWADRHFTACPDDLGLVAGDGTAYTTKIGCPSQQLLGFATDGGLWGYWVGGAICGTANPYPGNWQVIKPFVFAKPGCGGPGAVIPYLGSFGASEMTNTKSFNTYLNGRFYDKVYFAPKDRVGLLAADFGIQNEGEFTPGTSGAVVFPTYFWSPANMFNPTVLGTNGLPTGNTDCALAGQPNKVVSGAPYSTSAYRAPKMGMAAYPEQKTYMCEKLWLQNREGGESNFNCDGAKRLWLFNEGYNSSPVCSFIDGHVAQVGMSSAMADHKKVKFQNTALPCTLGRGLWHGGTPLGDGAGGGWFSPEKGYDGVTDATPTSFHILTSDGILGRDNLSPGGS